MYICIYVYMYICIYVYMYIYVYNISICKCMRKRTTTLNCASAYLQKTEWTMTKVRSLLASVPLFADFCAAKPEPLNSLLIKPVQVRKYAPHAGIHSCNQSASMHVSITDYRASTSHVHKRTVTSIYLSLYLCCKPALIHACSASHGTNSCLKTLSSARQRFARAIIPSQTLHTNK